MARRFQSRGRTIDFKQWIGLPGIELDLSAAATVSGGSIAFAISATILRIRGTVAMCLDGAADGADQFVTMALGIISTDAFVLGASAFPDPGGEPEYPWLYWRADGLKATQPTAIAAEASQSFSAVRYEFDSKAMRKVKPGESLVQMIQVNSGQGVDIQLSQVRVLIGT